MSGTKDLTAFPDGDNLFKWSASIKGAVGTVYDGLCYKLKIEFSSEYPYKGICPHSIFDDVLCMMSFALKTCL